MIGRWVANMTERPLSMRSPLALLRSLLPVAALVVVFTALSIISPFFLNPSNLQGLVNDSATLMLCAFGMTLVILIGEIDLSVGAVTSFLGVLLALALGTGMAWPLAAVAIILAGLLIGLINGAITVYGDIPSFIVTLGMMSVVTGLSFVLIGGIAVPITDVPFLDLLYFVQVAGVPVNFFIIAVCFAAAVTIRSRMVVGREMVAVGLNREAARMSGIRVQRTRMLAFAAMGVLVGIGAVLAAARLGSGAPNSFPSLTLDVIAAVVIGGASLFGGRAWMWRTLVGALLIAVLNNGMNLLNIESALQFTIKGALILIAVLVDQVGGRSSRNE